MELQELLDRLDIETDCLGKHLRELMKGDGSPVEHILATYELLEGGEEDEEGYTGETYVIKSFIVWTQECVYHSDSDEQAFLFEDGRVYRVPRHPTKGAN